MKYEISDLINEKYIYGLTILRIHQKVNKGVIFRMILKISISANFIIHLLFIIFNSMGTIILCSDFNNDYYNNNNKIYLSKSIRIITPYYLVEKLHLNNLLYIIICTILMIIYIILVIYSYYLLYKTHNFHISEVYSIKVNIIIIIIHHIIYIFFSYIIEFLSYIYYIELFPNIFAIKKNVSLYKNLNIIYMFLNMLFIILFNYYNYFFIELVNTPNADKKYPFRMRMPSLKLYILFLFQNLSAFKQLPTLLTDNQLKIWNLTFNIIIIILFILISVLSLKSFNFNNWLNFILSFLGQFCFVSKVIEILLYIFSINYKNIKQLILFTLLKIIVTSCLQYLLEIIYEKIMIREIKKGLFLKDSNNYSYDKNISSYILYLKEIIENNNKIFIIMINYLSDHQKYCQNKYCGCKIIKLASYNISDLNKNLNDFKQQINHYIETILIKFDFNYDFEFAYLLSEHFFIVKNNPIIAYSVLQTLLHNNYKNLSIKELLFIYGELNKYINFSLKEKMNKRNIKKFSYNITKELMDENKEYELKQYFNFLIKIKKSIKLMKDYSLSFTEIIKFKKNYENSVLINLDESDGEIISITSTLLTHSFISNIISFLEIENSKTINIKKYLCDLKEYYKIIPYDFLFKSFLFIDYFWNGIIPNELIDILFGFTSNRNLYTTNINQEIYDILEEKYYEEFNRFNSKFYLMLKYTKGLIIYYISELMLRKLNISKDEIINQDLGVLLITDLAIPHNNAINQNYMIKQNYIFRDKSKHIFDNKKYLIDALFNSTFQIGLNKNILIICIIQLNEKNYDITFLSNKNLEIISINEFFDKKFNLSLSLIEELKIEIKDIFDIHEHNIYNKYKKEYDKIREIRQYIHLDPKEYVLRNIFKQKNVKDNYRFTEDIILMNTKENNGEQNEDEENNKLFNENKKNSFLKMVHNIYNNKNPEFFLTKSINFIIDKETVKNKIRKMVEKLSGYEKGKLENKNLYQDYLKFIRNYNNIFLNNNISLSLNIKLKLIYDTPFYLCKLEQYENNILIKEEMSFFDRKLILSKDHDKDIVTPISNKRTCKMKNFNYYYQQQNIKNNDNSQKNKEKEISDIDVNDNLRDEKEKIKVDKISKKLLGFILISLICGLLIIYIIILIYQMNLITQGDKIFKTLYYNYYQKSQLLYINTIILSMQFNLVNLTDINSYNENREILLSLGIKLEEGFHLFYHYYMDFKSGIGEDVEELYRKREVNKITINWKNQIIFNNYIKEMHLLLYNVFTSSENYTEGDIEDCEYFLLGKFINNTNNNKTETHGTLIMLLYYILYNYDPVWAKFYDNLTESLEISFNKFSERTIKLFLLLEVLGILIYIIFFLINFIFLYKSNKYIFHNILCLFLDFTQNNKYTFNNKIDNLLISKSIINYISLLNEFTPQKLEILQNNFNINSDNVLLNNKDENQIFGSSMKDENENVLKKSKRRKKAKRTISGIKLNNLKANTHSTSAIKNDNNESNDIHKLNYSNLSNFKVNYKPLNQSMSNNLISRSINDNNTDNNTQNNSSLINIKELSNNSLMINNSSLINSTKINSNNNKEEDISNISDSILSIEKIILFSKVILIQMVKIIMIIFIIFSIIFIVYYLIKIILGFIIIKKIGQLYDDFKVLCSHYNEVIHYWNNMKTLFILPNTSVYTDLNDVEKFFDKKNNDVLNVISTRINSYKRISVLYYYLFNSKTPEDLLNANFCGNFQKCYDVINSTQNILLNGLNSAVSLYGKEIENFYRDYFEVKNNINNKEDIKKFFIKDTFTILGLNINHIIIHMQAKFFSDFLKDEEELNSGFYTEIKIFNIIALCYCIALNLFSLLFVFNYVNKIIAFVENSTMRIILAICHLKNKIRDFNN